MKRLFIIFSLGTLLSCTSHESSMAQSPIKLPVEKISATKDQLERRKKSEDYCQAHGVPVYQNPTALFVDAEDQVTIRTKEEVVDRALALFYLGLKSEGLEQVHLDALNKDFHITSKLSPLEKAYASAKQPTEQQKIDANWRYESLHVLLWALGFVDSLSYPNRLCDVAGDVKIIHGLTEQQFRQKARLRTKKEVLDQADQVLRLHWACVNARLTNDPPPGGLDPGVVYERHYSLNWLINYLDQEWDDVSTDT